MGAPLGGGECTQGVGSLADSLADQHTERKCAPSHVHCRQRSFGAEEHSDDKEGEVRCDNTALRVGAAVMPHDDRSSTSNLCVPRPIMLRHIGRNYKLCCMGLERPVLSCVYLPMYPHGLMTDGGWRFGWIRPCLHLARSHGQIHADTQASSSLAI